MKPERSSAAARNQKQKAFDLGGRLALDDGTILYSRDQSPYIWADYGSVSGKRIRRSTDTDSLQQAETVAKKVRKWLVAGKDPSATGPTVGDLLRAYLAKLDERADQGDASVKPQRSALANNLLPYWDNVPIRQLNRNRFLDWEQDRKKSSTEQTVIRTYRRGDATVRSKQRVKPASAQTVQREKTHFVAVLDWGRSQLDPWVTEEVVNEIRFPHRRKRTAKKQMDERRDAMSSAEQQTLAAESERLLAQWRGTRRNYARRLMICHYQLLLASGLRPGAEITELRWSDMERVTVGTLGDTMIIHRCGNGKTGSRVVTCQPSAIPVVEQLKALLQEFGFLTVGDAPLWPRRGGGVVQDFNGSFKALKRKLKFDSKSAEQPLYACRHTYISDRLLEGVQTAVVAQNCGTSEEMIERHYKHLKAEGIRAILIAPAVSAAAFTSRFSGPLELNLCKHDVEVRLSRPTRASLSTRADGFVQAEQSDVKDSLR